MTTLIRLGGIPGIGSRHWGLSLFARLCQMWRAGIARGPLEHFLRNVSSHSYNGTVSHPRRHKSSDISLSNKLRVYILLVRFLHLLPLLLVKVVFAV